jgi:hypothetical protein
MKTGRAAAVLWAVSCPADFMVGSDKDLLLLAEEVKEKGGIKASKGIRVQFESLDLQEDSKRAYKFG